MTALWFELGKRGFAKTAAARAFRWVMTELEGSAGKRPQNVGVSCACFANRLSSRINALGVRSPVFRLFFHGRAPPLPMKEAEAFSVCPDPAKPLSPAP
jgi:hypothetical protein